MNVELKYAISNIGAGWVGVLGSNSGLLRVTLPQGTAREVEWRLGDRVKEAMRADDFFGNLLGRLGGYFAGQRVTFADELDLSRATAFQREVWRLTRLIPYGETRSYGWVAEQLGKAGAGRAVGQALGRNPLPVIVPCHRVVAKDGGLGGYSGGVAEKDYLLRLESPAN
ncbi:MAG: methylated-DNA--[protein]-cysteine S-methyltransferase [Deltaproteobacteria bacterium]|nr:methylated-DNA--[protein]-cysteine S-methyltransferase [Deltaproteobacteria bacterium]